jgi:predicted DCC family thiol-disulfide oxidoreductase YuxK
MTETPDTNGIPTGTRVFFDDRCPVCQAAVKRWRPVFEARGILFHGMREPWVRELLRIPTEGFPDEMKARDGNGRIRGGLDAIAWLCREVWWLWPAGVLMEVPGLHALAKAVYRWVARNRYCLGDVCTVPTRPLHLERHHAATTFLEMP